MKSKSNTKQIPSPKNKNELRRVLGMATLPELVSSKVLRENSCPIRSTQTGSGDARETVTIHLKTGKMTYHKHFNSNT